MTTKPGTMVTLGGDNSTGVAIEGIGASIQKGDANVEGVGRVGEEAVNGTAGIKSIAHADSTFGTAAMPQ